MKTPPQKSGKVFADLHCHLRRPKNRKEAQSLVEKLSSGITGITEVYGNEGIITYEELVKDLKLQEVNKGLLAKVEHDGNKGYILKTQEAAEGEIAPHFLTLAPENYIENNLESEKIIERAKKQNALVILAHPFTIPATKEDFLINRFFQKPLIKYRILNYNEQLNTIKLCPLIDEIELHNAQNINAIPIFLDMTKSNELVSQWLKLYNDHTEKKFKGIASSDAHYRLEQIQKAGIYLPEENESYLLESILENIKTGNFEKYEQYISRPSFLAGMFLS